ncbi:MAG: alpha/beta hydrolase [bacterium]|nr:alpha/beta hydrolase [bacterium]
MGSGTPVVLLHSSMSSKLQWYGLMQMMKKDHLMIAIDLYGEGETPWPEKTEGFGLTDEVKLVESLLADIILPDEPVYLVGHSYGGAVALRYAHEYKDRGRIRGMALFEPVSFHLLPESEEALARVRKTQEICRVHLEQGNRYAAAEYFVDRWSGAGTFSGFPESFRETLLKSVDKLHLSRPALMNEPITLEDCKDLILPVLIMVGKETTFEGKRVAELLNGHLSNSTFKWIDGGHMAPIHQALEVNTIIADFIRQNPC